MKKIILINFQLHKYLELELDEHLTVIIGSNNSGKSSVIRAINWVFYNQPAGDWMRRINSSGELENTTVKIIFKDGTIIKRTKGDGINKYKVDDEEFENFGFKVPEPVLKKLKIYPFKTNKEIFNINVSMQDEQPFLIHDSSTTKASVLDVLTGNSIIQKAISEIRKDNLKISKDIDEFQQEITQDEETLKGLPDIVKAQSILDVARQFENDLVKTEKELEYLRKMYADLKDQQNIIQKIVDVNVDIEPIYKLVSSLEKIKKENEELVRFNKEYQKAKKSICKISDISTTLLLYGNYKKIGEELVSLRTFSKNYNSFKKQISETTTSISEMEKELKQIYIDNPLCPSCGNKWSK